MVEAIIGKEGSAVQTIGTTPDVNKKRKPRLEQLDGFRFLVALWLVIAHNFDPEVNTVGGLYERFSVRRYFGVQFFIVLSGFVSQYAYGERSFQLRENLRKFYIGRVGSILGCYYFTQLVAIIIHTAAGHYSMSQVAVGVPLSLFLLQSWLPKYAYFGNAPAWTLSTLVAHWALYPLLQPRLKEMSDKMLKVLAFMIPIVSLIPTVVTLFFMEPSSSVTEKQWYALYTHPILRFPDFVFGCIASEIFIRADNTSWRLPNLSKIADVSMAGILALILAIPYVKRNSIVDTLMIEAPMYLFGLLVYCGSCDPRGSISGYIMSLDPCRELGDFAFQVYLFRWPLFAIIHWIEVGKLKAGWMYLSTFYLLPAIVILYVISYLWYVYVDTPLRLYLATVTKPSSDLSTELVEKEKGVASAV